MTLVQTSAAASSTFRRHLTRCTVGEELACLMTTAWSSWLSGLKLGTIQAESIRGSSSAFTGEDGTVRSHTTGSLSKPPVLASHRWSGLTASATCVRSGSVIVAAVRGVSRWVMSQGSPHPAIQPWRAIGHHRHRHLRGGGSPSPIPPHCPHRRHWARQGIRLRPAHLGPLMRKHPRRQGRHPRSPRAAQPRCGSASGTTPTVAPSPSPADCWSAKPNSSPTATPGSQALRSVRRPAAALGGSRTVPGAWP